MKFERSFFNPKYTLVLVYQHLHNHDPNCMYSLENQIGIKKIEDEVRKHPKYRDFCLA